MGKWLKLKLIRNCFNEGRNHLGVKYNNKLYCISHAKSSSACIIPKHKMKNVSYSPKNEYLKKVLYSKAIILHGVNAYIEKKFVKKYTEFHDSNT